MTRVDVKRGRALSRCECANPREFLLKRSNAQPRLYGSQFLGVHALTRKSGLHLQNSELPGAADQSGYQRLADTEGFGDFLLRIFLAAEIILLAAKIRRGNNIKVIFLALHGRLKIIPSAG